MKNDKRKLTTTEKFAAFIICFCIFYLMLIFALALLGRAQVLENLGIALITTILGSFVAVAAKNLMQKMSANKNKIDISTGLPFEMGESNIDEEEGG